MENNNPENLSDKEQEKVSDGNDAAKDDWDITIAELEGTLEEKNSEYFNTKVDDPRKLARREELFRLNRDIINAYYCKQKKQT